MRTHGASAKLEYPTASLVVTSMESGPDRIAIELS